MNARVAFLSLVLGGCATGTRYEQLRYVPESDDPSLTLETRDLVFKVIDNTGILAPPPETKSASYFNYSHQVTPFVHHLGYHGVRTLYHKAQRRNMVIPFASWLNLQKAGLEGIDPDPVDERAHAGKGRGWPLRLESKGKGALLILDPLPSMQMKYTLELQPAEPDGIDFVVRFEFARKSPRFSASWPCYINAYDDGRLFYPKGSSAKDMTWVALGENPDCILGEAAGYRHKQKGFRVEQPALPLAYGRIGDFAVVLMFSDPRVKAFVVNAGGHLAFSSVQNPAWDFSWDLENVPLHEPVGFEGRILYTRFHSNDEILRLYRSWMEEKAKSE